MLWLRRAVGVVSSTSRKRLGAGTFYRCVSSGAAQSTEAVAEVSKTELIADWSLRLNIENTYLNWVRNSMIATVAGMAIVQYKVGTTDVHRAPASGLGFIFLAFCFSLLGPANYLYSYLKLRQVISLKPHEWVWILCNAFLTPTMWMLSMRCFMFGSPSWVRQKLDDLADEKMKFKTPTRALFPSVISEKSPPS
eukprot:TRINITY_DN64003_c0_g1_i1.p1 TRINITY_DN64003_c0_g1~~TRINITY_DN64003_c0_g1_i1.p1  ORF type:complete len:194 (-),score=24.76 TRINITY_DN64003_c0_g1_i1:63-644(-)